MRKIQAYLLAIKVSFPSIRVIFLENLYVTDIKALYPSLFRGRIRIKLNIRVKKGISNDYIGYKEL